MHGLIIFVCLICALGEVFSSLESNRPIIFDPYDTVRIVSEHKYPIEEYSVKTADGYILKIHRVQCRHKKSRKHKSVLIMSDFWSSSVFWVMSGPKYSLVYYLADLGYDVWLGNNRGSKYGQDGIVLKPNDPKFWFYSFHELGVYDLPAIIDFMLTKVKCRKINYIGWGFGATQFFVMASVKPEYVKKIKNMQALAPSTYIKNIRSKLGLVVGNLKSDCLSDLIGQYAVLCSEQILKISGQNNCLKIAKNKKICNHIQSMAIEEFDKDIPGYPDVLDYPPVQASSRYIMHIQQQIKNGFRYFDNGEISNQFFYGTKTPPKYNLAAADLPIAIYYSDANVVYVPKDVLELANDLPNVIGLFKIDDDTFGHMDFPMTKDGRHLYYKSIKEILELD